MDKDPDLSPARGDEARAVARAVLVEPPSERETPVEEDPVVPLHERLLGILLAPVATFRALEPRWGWLGPWLAIALVGCFAGVVRQSCTDLKGAKTAQQEHAIELMSDSQRRLYDQMPEDTRLMSARAAVFFAKIGDFAAPTVGAVVEILVVAFVLYCASLLFNGKKDLLLAVVVSAHAKAIVIVGYLIFAVAAFLGNPLPTLGLEHATNELQHPILAAALAGADPIALWHSGLLAVGLCVALSVRWKPAVLVVAGLHGSLWLIHIALATATAQASGGQS